MSRTEWKRTPEKHLGRLQEIRVHFGMFRYAFRCVIGPWDDLPAYVAYRHKDRGGDWWTEPPPRGIHFFSASFEGAIVWLPKIPRTPAEIGTLAHEVLHVVQELGAWADIRPCHETREIYCHALGHGVETVLEEFRK